MRIENGISIVLADSDVEIQALLKILDVPEAFPLGMLPQLCLSNPEAVFFEVVSDEAQMRRLAEHFRIRRGVLSVRGKREFLGFNVDWMGRVMVSNDLDRAIQSTVTPKPRPVLVVCQDEDRDDPYESLGYARR